MALALVVLALLVAFVIWRQRHTSGLVAASNARRPFAANGIVAGGEGFVLERPDAPAILLLHGAGDTPQVFSYLAEELHRRGFHVVAPLLPGHGRTVRDFARVTADVLMAAAREHFANLRREREWVGLIGLSMGGALAVQLAAETRDLPALALAAPYLAMPWRIERAASLAWLWGPLVPVVSSAEGISVLDAAERERSLAYGVFTPRALAALRTIVRRAVTALPRVAAPTLVIHSREDNRISVENAERAFALLGAPEKRLEWISGAAHVITVDFGREKVIASLASWMEAHRVSR